jgi:hypothetical protein
MIPTCVPVHPSTEGGLKGSQNQGPRHSTATTSYQPPLRFMQTAQPILKALPRVSDIKCTKVHKETPATYGMISAFLILLLFVLCSHSHWYPSLHTPVSLHALTSQRLIWQRHHHQTTFLQPIQLTIHCCRQTPETRVQKN